MKRLRRKMKIDATSAWHNTFFDRPKAEKRFTGSFSERFGNVGDPYLNAGIPYLDATALASSPSVAMLQVWNNTTSKIWSLAFT